MNSLTNLASKIIEVISGGDISKEAYTSKDGIMVNSDFLNGLKASEAIPAVLAKNGRNEHR